MTRRLPEAELEELEGLPLGEGEAFLQMAVLQLEPLDPLSRRLRPRALATLGHLASAVGP